MLLFLYFFMDYAHQVNSACDVCLCSWHAGAREGVAADEDVAGCVDLRECQVGRTVHGSRGVAARCRPVNVVEWLLEEYVQKRDIKIYACCQTWQQCMTTCRQQ
jgi:hypothetical protein